MANAVKILKYTDLPKEEGLHPRLVCLTGENKGKAYYFVGKRVVLGRGEGVDIKVLDIKTSREHADIVLLKDGYIITDLGSQNGIIVNDQKTKQAKLSSGDKITIGSTVYRFDFVKGEAAQVKKINPTKINVPVTENEDPSKMKKLMIGAVLVLIAAIVFLPSDNKSDGKKKEKKGLHYDVNQFTASHTASAQRDKMDDKTKEKLNVYFNNGLREYREHNYYRAISEFNHALTWAPGDALALFYLRKTKEALNKSVDNYFIEAKRDEESLKYQKAIVSYCAIMRLLFSDPDNDKFKEAKEGVRRMEDLLGMKENEVKCVDSIDEAKE